MYKFIIVDDEEVVREGFRQFIDWHSLGFNLIECFEDGKDAIDYLEEKAVDVVLTDIDMVHVNGIELSRYIHNHCPSTKTIIVSGHKDFDYAKKAIEYNVEHYLLKPTEINEITSLFQKIRVELDSKIKQEEEEKKYRQRYIDLIPLLREQFLLYVLTGSINTETELVSRLEEIDLPFSLAAGECCVIDVSINTEQAHNGFGNDYFKKTLQKFFHCERSGNYYISSFFNQEDMKILVLSTQSNTDEFMAILESDIEKIKKTIQKNFGIFLTFEKSQIYHNLVEIFQDINRVASSNLDLGVISKSVMEVKEYRELIKQYKDFITLIIEGKEIEASLNDIVEQLEAYPIQDVQRLIIDLFSMITHTFVEMGINVFELNKGKMAYKNVLNMNSIKEIQLWCCEYLQQIIDYYSKNKNNTSALQVVNQAKEYIRHMYHKEVSLEEVADHVYLSHVYFSRLFKKHTGTNFSDYLTSVRIEKAIELLKENKYKTYEISEKVGYKSSRYFSRVFKQATGCAPKEYCRKFFNDRSFVNE